MKRAVIVTNDIFSSLKSTVNPLNAELNFICHLLALLGGATIAVVSRLRVNVVVTRTMIVPIYILAINAGCYFVGSYETS